MKIDKIANITDILVGAWLLLSVLLWRHSPGHLATGATVGALSVLLGGLAYWKCWAWPRWIVAALSVWLVLSLWAIPGASVGTVVNFLVMGSLLFGFSALPTGRGRSIGESMLRPKVG